MKIASKDIDELWHNCMAFCGKGSLVIQFTELLNYCPVKTY